MRATIILILGILFLACSEMSEDNFIDLSSDYYTEQYRPQYHFTPKSKWMNDPNGMVYYEGEYHLFYQYYPDSNVWGPMHWGHAASTDLVHWEHLPIGLYPDSLGWIFSGSAVVDWNNTSGLGVNGTPPLVAIYTYHSQSIEQKGQDDFQYQGLAYSNDKGRTWVKYENNPVLPNPGIRDFRDPKVSWSEDYNKWVMTLAVKDHVAIYSSSDLKSWKYESDFGKEVGAHGGVWECPDLFPMKDEQGSTKWVLLVSINPGAPNGGSGTQYFIGNFDGKNFINENPSADAIWLDWGKDNYAGVTWNDMPKEDGRRIFMGWMSNWQYATTVPTEKWRSGMTLPRELKLFLNEGKFKLAAKPVHEINSILNREMIEDVRNVEITSAATSLFEGKINGGPWKTELHILPGKSKTLKINIKNALNEELSLRLNIAENKIEFDRTNAGKKDFSSDFAVPISGQYTFNSLELKVEMYWDENGIEIFVNDGEFQMTNLVFPTQNWNAMEVTSEGTATLSKGTYTPIKKIWK